MYEIGIEIETGDLDKLSKGLKSLGSNLNAVTKALSGSQSTAAKLITTLGTGSAAVASFFSAKTLQSAKQYAGNIEKVTAAMSAMDSGGEAVALTAEDLGRGVQTAIPLTTKFGAALKGVFAIIKPFIPVIIALGAAFIAFKVAMIPVKLGLKVIRGAVDLTKKVFIKLKDVLLSIATTIKDKVVAAFSSMVSKVKSLLRSLVDRFVNWASSADTSIEGVTQAFEIFTDQFSLGSKVVLSALKAASYGMVSHMTLMKGYNVAAQAIGQTFTETLPQAYQYFSKIAMATGEDFDYLMNSYIKGISRLSPKILDNLHIQVSLNEAKEEAARIYGKATDALTREEIQAGMTEVTLRKLARTTAILPDPTDTLAQKIGALTANLQNLRDKITAIFIPAAKAVVDLFNKIITSATGMEKPLRYVSAVIAVLAEELTKLVPAGVKAITDFAEKFGGKLEETAWKALKWGAEIATQLAIGLAEGAASSLIVAMNFISGLLERWLAPKSPPLVALGIAKWGAETFTEWLKGFSNADFDVLERVQAPLERALRALVGMGELEGIGESFDEITKAMAAYLAGSGSLEDALERLRAVGGGYGDQLEDMFLKMLKVAGATKAVADAEKRLADAQKRYETNREDLIEGAREYNRLLREGADEATLKAKLEELKVNYKNMKAAEKQVEEEEDNLEIAKEHLKLMKDQARAQERLLNQIIKIAEILAKERKDEEAPGIGLPDLPDFEGIGATIDEALENLKARIREKFKEIWDEIVKTWEESEVGELWAKVVETWEKSRLKEWLTVDLPAWFKASKKRIAEVGFWAWLKEDLFKFKEWLISTLPPVLQKFVRLWQSAWKAAKKAWNDFWSGFKLGFLPFKKEIKDAYENLLVRLGVAFENLEEVFDTFEERVGISLPGVIGIFIGATAGLALIKTLELITGAVDILNISVLLLQDAFLWATDRLAWLHTRAEWFEKTLLSIVPHIQRVRDWMQRLIDKVGELARKFAEIVLPWWMTPGSPTPLELGIKGITGAMKDLPPLKFAPTGGLAGGGTMQTVSITNNFGKDSVRSREDIREIMNAQERMLNLQGVRT